VHYRGKHRELQTHHTHRSLDGVLSATFVTAMAALGVVSGVATLNWFLP